MSFYVWKIKISIDSYVSRYHVGFTFIPKYKYFEISLGKYTINFWYREDLVK